MDGIPRVVLGAVAAFERRAALDLKRGWELALTAAAVFGVGTLAAFGAHAPDRDAGEQLTLGAQLAQRQCYGLIHHDTFEFRDCLRNLLVDPKLPPTQRLGGEYFGWAGAVNSARLGMKGAEATSFEFLHRFRATQKVLGVDDRRLCAAVPGDCETRMVLMLRMEAARSPSEVSGDD